MEKKFRFTADKHVKTDTRNHPLPFEGVDKSSELRVDCNSGDLIVFSDLTFTELYLIPQKN